MDHAGANYHLLTYTSWSRHTGLFSVTSFKIRSWLSFLFLAWLHLHQVRAIMCDWRKCELLILPTVLTVGSKSQTSEAELFSPLPHCSPATIRRTVIIYVLYSATLTWQIQVNIDLLSPSLKLQHLWLVWISWEVSFLPSSLLLFLLCTPLYRTCTQYILSVGT